jgi:hypothetical protein
LPSSSRRQVAGSSDWISQAAPPRTSRNVCSDTARPRPLLVNGVGVGEAAQQQRGARPGGPVGRSGVAALAVVVEAVEHAAAPTRQTAAKSQNPPRRTYGLHVHCTNRTCRPSPASPRKTSEGHPLHRALDRSVCAVRRWYKGSY